MKSRFIGLVITVIVIAGVWLIWRSGRSTAGPVRPPAVAARGGQVVASIRTDPTSFNPISARGQITDEITAETADLVGDLMQGRLVRVNRATFELEPWLAERWESNADGRTHTLHLRAGLTWSDGVPLTSADVLFSLQAAFDVKSKSAVAGALSIDGKPIRAAAPDPQTVVLTFPGPSGPGLRLLDALTILPKHSLEAALKAGTFASAWNAGTPPATLVGSGPFLLREYQPGQRLVFERNPRYWRKASDGGALPYLDRLVLEIVPDARAQLQRVQSGTSDLMSGELPEADYAAVRTAEQMGALAMPELGVSTDADALWFCLKPEAKKADPRFAFVQKPEFRQALSHAVDRENFAETVFQSLAVPIWGPLTPGNRQWFWPDVPRYQPDQARARTLLKSIGLEDRNGNGIVEDAAGTEARFTLMTEQGVGWYERGTSLLRTRAAGIGVALDVVPVEAGVLMERLRTCNYDAIYMRPHFADLDPAGNLDFWLSSRDKHLWNMNQRSPGTDWERRIDTIMIEQAAEIDPARRRSLLDDAQRIFAENLPVLWFAAPRMYGAQSTRLGGVVPSVMRPQVLWSADTLSVQLTP